MRAAIIYNPKSGRHASARLLEEVGELLRAGGIDAVPRPTRGPGDAEVLAREAAEEGFETVFGMGGDGTLREVASGLLAAQEAGAEASLGILPAGTANVLSISLGVPGAALGAALAYSKGWSHQEIDVGRAEGEAFLMMVSGGLDARIMEHQNSEMKRRFGKAAVAVSGLAQWLRYEFPPAVLRVDGEELQGTFFAICNIPHYGGSFRMAPADPSDGVLDLVLLRSSGRLALAVFAINVFLGARHLKHPDVIVRRVREVEIMASPQLPIQVDGDVPGFRAPFRVTTGERLKVLLPAALR